MDFDLSRIKDLPWPPGVLAPVDVSWEVSVQGARLRYVGVPQERVQPTVATSVAPRRHTVRLKALDRAAVGRGLSLEAAVHGAIQKYLYAFGKRYASALRTEYAMILGESGL